MVQESASRGLDKVIVRLPDGMRAYLKGEAEKNKRSLNAEIVARLEASVSAPKPIGEPLPKGEFMEFLYPVLVELIERYQRGEKPTITFKRKPKSETAD